MPWSRFIRRRWWDNERARELEAYLTMETDDNIARGMSPEDARVAALRKLGNRTIVREEIYQMNTVALFDTAWRDLRFGARLLARSPLFSLVAILSLALGIGANAAIFQLLDAVQFRTLQVKSPEQLVEIRPIEANRWGNATGRRAQLTYELWQQIRSQQHVFSGLFAWGVNGFDLSTGGESRLAAGLWVSGEFFDVLGVPPMLGRLLTPRDDLPGCGSPGVVISYAFWQREYGGDRSAVGRSLRLDGRPFEILGVTPASFFGVEVGRSFDVAVPICAEPLVEPARNAVAKRHYWWLDVFGRLRPDQTLRTAAADLAAISPAVFAASVAPAFPPQAAKQFLELKLGAYPAGTGVSYLRGQYQEPLWILLAVAGLVLLIACANLANLMLARATAREREIAVRLAIGASRARIVRQLLAESLLLAAIGAALGVFLAQSLSRFLVAFLSTDSARLFFDLRTDWRVLAFTCTLGCAACLLFGLAPALRATVLTGTAVLKISGRGMIDGGERFGLRRALVAGQMALSLVLIVGALLFVRTVRNLARVDPGFRTDGVLIAEFDTRAARVPPLRQPQFQRDLRARVAAIPGVRAAADAAIEPLSGSVWNDHVVVDGVVQRTIANENHVSPAFFALLDMPLLAGRDFDDRDLPGAPFVAIVNEQFAERILNTKQPIGRTFKLQVSPGELDPTYEVIGVTRNTKYADVREAPTPIAYFPEAQIPDPDAGLVEVQMLVRSNIPPSALRGAITAVTRDVNPGMLVSFRVLGEDIRRSFLRERLMATLSTFFAALAVLLATIGLYGVMSYMVARRTNEIGIRMALGAGRSQVVTMIMGEAGMLLGAGLFIGVALSLAVARAAASLLFGLTPHDPSTLAMASGGLGAVAIAASYLPAWRASRLEPTAALREE
jgi:putative ABC transport system permease protein